MRFATIWHPGLFDNVNPGPSSPASVRAFAGFPDEEVTPHHWSHTTVSPIHIELLSAALPAVESREGWGKTSTNARNIRVSALDQVVVGYAPVLL